MEVLKKKLRRNRIKMCFIFLCNLLLTGGLLKIIPSGNIDRLKIFETDINTDSFFISKIFIGCLCLGIYILVSLAFIRWHYKRKVKNIYLSSTMEDVDDMTGIEFEYFLYYKFRQRKYKVKTTPITGDYGADLILKKGKEKIVVQAKRYQSDVGIGAVQEVIGSIAFYDALKGIVITNSYFTPNAINLANANDIILWDRNVLIREFMEEEEIKEDRAEENLTPGYCPYCGKTLVYRSGKYGRFIGCSGYPQCNYTASVNEMKL